MSTNQNRFYKDRAWLHQVYHVQDQSIQDIADFCGVTWLTIHNWMERLGVPRRPPGTAPNIADTRPYADEDWLREQYHDRGQTVAEIASYCEVSYLTIYNWMRRYGIARRPPGRPLTPTLTLTPTSPPTPSKH